MPILQVFVVIGIFFQIQWLAEQERGDLNTVLGEHFALEISKGRHGPGEIDKEEFEQKKTLTG